MGRSRAKFRLRDVDLGFESIARKAARDAAKGAQIYNVGYSDSELATRAAYNEFGTDRAPPRPFLRQAFDLSEKGLERDFTDRARDISGPSSGAPKPVVDTADDYKTEVVATINAWSDPENAESTVNSKGRNEPLVRTGAMRDGLEVVKG